MSEGLNLSVGHMNELLTAAMRHRDLCRADANDVRKKNQELDLEIRRLKIKIEALEARLDRSEREKDDLQGFNNMLQRMIKRAVSVNRLPPP